MVETSASWLSQVNPQTVLMVVTAAVLLLSAAAESLHVRRILRVRSLAFGPYATNTLAWVIGAGLLRVLAITAVAWGLVVLLQLSEVQWTSTDDAETAPLQHVVIGLDVSPSMHIEDAGPDGKQSRADRARDVMRSVLERLDLHNGRVSIIAFYSEARPVVVDTFDPEVVSNVLGDLPLEQAFPAGATDLYEVVREADKLATRWPTESADLIIVSDGDTLPADDRPTLGKAFKNISILGVGNPFRGTYVHDHQSRQDRRSLSRLASQLGGVYTDVNAHHLASEDLPAAAPPMDSGDSLAWRQLAVAAVALGALVLAVMPLVLAVVGNLWQRRQQRETVLLRHHFEPESRQTSQLARTRERTVERASERTAEEVTV